MTRHPARQDGQKTRVLKRGNDTVVGWRWYCDQPLCGNATAIVVRNQLPTPEEMRTAGWFVAKSWNDICPVCLAAGVRPPMETVLVAGGAL